MFTRRDAILAPLALGGVMGCGSAPGPTGTDSRQAGAAIAGPADALMRDLAGRQRFQGAVVIGQGGRITYSAGFGLADITRQRPFTPDTPTDGASIAKTFTSAALLMLVEEGRLGLETPVHELLPAYPHRQTRVRHLLAHSAGLPDYEWLDSRVTPDQPRTNAGHLTLVAVAEGRAPERLEAPPPADAAVDPTGTYHVKDVGSVDVRRTGPQLWLRLQAVDYQGFAVARGVHYVPGHDAYVRFAAAAQGPVTMGWSSVWVNAPAVPRAVPGSAPPAGSGGWPR